jgi:protein-S-isoprenylcysteine O-methyltransferase Ste14
MITGGVLLLLAGVGIAAWTASVLGWRRMMGLDSEPPHPALPVLVFAGPYQFARHPRALAVVFVSLGAATIGHPVPIWLCGSTAVAALLAAVWRDRRLLGEFGEAYRRYRQAVPFLVPYRCRRS